MDLSVFRSFANQVSQHGNEVAMCCPFHKRGQEAHPSFSYNIESHLWHCHRCHVGGRGLANLLEQIGYDHDDVLSLKVGLARDQQEPDLEDIPDTRVYTNDLLFAEQMFRGEEDWSIPTPERGYLYGRNMMDETLRHFHVRILSGVGHKSIFFPLFYRGPYRGRMREVVFGWQRRSPNEWERPKYLTMPKLQKSHYLYGELLPGELLVLCEGVTDVMMGSQRGEQSIVATLGSYPSLHQWEMIQQAGGIVCAYHDDEAGNQGYEVLKKLCGWTHFLARLKLRTDIAKSRIDEYHEAMDPLIERYQHWRKQNASLEYDTIA